MFHHLAKMCADLIVGSEPETRGETAWNQVYRSLQHRVITAKYQEATILKFPQEIQDFSLFFRRLQIRREQSDHCHAYSQEAESIRFEIGLARRHFRAMAGLEEKHRKALAVYMLLDSKQHR